MAYYNPDDPQGYYNPYQNSADGGEKTSVVSALTSAARNMLLIGGLSIIGGKIVGKASQSLGKAIKAGAFGKGKAYRLAQNVKNPSLGNIAQQTSSYKQARNWFQSTSIGKARAQRISYLKTINKDSGSYGVERVLTAFKSPATFASAVGNTWMKYAVMGAPVEYAVESALGFTNQEKKKLFDIPGHISNAAKWFAAESVYATGFGALGPLAGLGKGLIKGGVTKVFEGPIGKYLLKTIQQVQGNNLPQFAAKLAPHGSLKASHIKGNDYFYKESLRAGKHLLERSRSTHGQTFAAKVIKAGISAVSSVSEISKYADRISGVTGQAIKEGLQTPGTFTHKVGRMSGPVIAAIKNAKRIASDIKKGKTGPRNTKQYAGVNAAVFLTEFAHKIKTSTSIKAGESKTLDSIRDLFAYEIKRGQRKSVVETTNKRLSKYTLRDIASENWINDTFGSLGKKFAKDDIELLKNQMLNMQVGTNLYKINGGHIKGGGVDLSAFDPIHTAKRALSFLFEKDFRVPLAKTRINIGDLTGWNDALAEKPTLHYFRHKPDFRLAQSNLIEGKITVGDLAQNGDAQFLYVRGKRGQGHWGIFDGENVQTITQQRQIEFSRQHGKAKTREIEYIKRQRQFSDAAKAGKLDEMSQHLQGGPQSKYKWLNYLNQKGLKLPGYVEKLTSWMDNKLGNRKEAYLNSINDIFGTGDSKDPFSNLPNIESILQLTSQGMSRILHDKKALAEIGAFTNSKLLEKNLVTTLFNNSSIEDKFKSLGLTIDDLHSTISKDKGFNEAIQMIEAFPRQAERNIVRKRLGTFSDMNSYDVEKTVLLDKSINKHYLGALAGNGDPHPLFGAADSLFQKGMITEKDMKMMKLHAKLSALRDNSMLDNVGMINVDSKPQEVIHNIRRFTKQQNWSMVNELTDFIHNNPLRNPTIIRSRNEIMSLNRVQKSGDPSPFVSRAKGPRGAWDFANSVSDTFGNLLEDVSPFRRDDKYYGLGGTARYVIKNAAAVGLLWQGYRVADALVASTPILDYTAADEGITGLISDTIAKTRLGAGRLSDTIGITKAMKRMEGLMPMSTSTLPGIIVGAAAGKVFGGGLGSSLAGMAYGAVINRIADPYLPDFTKSYDELREIYSGREQVPFMKSPTWLLGGTPWEGSKVAGYSPNWYVQAKSRWKETDTLYGSAFRKLIHQPIPLLGFNIGDIVDPYYLERKHYFNRPYPVTGEFGKEIPIVGPLISSTIGRLIKPKKTMHQEFLSNDYEKEGADRGTYAFNNPPPTVQENLRLMGIGKTSLRSMGNISALGGAHVYGTKYWADSSAKQTLARMTNAAGLQGFLGNTALEKALGSPEVMPTLEMAGRMASLSREFYDMNLGGMGILTEPVRRLIQKPEYKRYGINPIPNLLPNWLPDHFLTGDAYSKIMKGELRLPGSAYLSTHTDVRRDFPGRASMIGGNLEHIVQYMTGLLPPVLKEEYDILNEGTRIHEQIQDQLQAEGLLIQAEALVQDVKNNITGHVDAIIKDGQGGKGRRALEIKTISQEGFEKLDGPKYQHIGQLNFYLRQLQMKEGSIIYVVRDNPAMVKTYNIQYSKTRWEKDLNKLIQARQITADMLQQGVGDVYGYSFSWLDRLNILADVAPTSKEFSEAKNIVEKQIAAGQFTEKEISKYKKILSHRQARIRKYELYPTRFKGKVLSPDSERNIQSINEEILAADQYTLPERIAGSLWERFTNTNHFVVNKLWNVKDPLEHYKMNRLYGKEFKPWDEPFRSFIEPLGRGLAGKRDAFSGALGWGTTGFVWGGNAMGALGAAVGAGYGAVHGLYRNITGTEYIPGLIQEQRSIEEYFDAAKYVKNKRLADLTNGLTSQNFLAEANNTMIAFNQGEGGNISQLFRSTPFAEKPYIAAWLNEQDPDARAEILRYIPSNLGNALKKQWSKSDDVSYTNDLVKNISVDVASGSPRASFDSSIFDPAISLEDIKLRTSESHGIDAHEFGLGWNEQQLRLMSYDHDVKAADMSRFKETPREFANLNQGSVRSAILNSLRQAGVKAKANVFINNYTDDTNSVNIIIRRDRSRSILESLHNREKWM